MCGFAQDLARKLVPDRASEFERVKGGIILKGVDSGAEGTWLPERGFALADQSGMTLAI